MTRPSSFLCIALLVLSLSSTCFAENNARPRSLVFPEARISSLREEASIIDLKTKRRSSSSQLAQKTALSLIGGATDVPTSKAVQGVIMMALIEAGVKKILAAANIKFPSQLGGCIALFVVSVLAQILFPGTGDKIYDFLLPGANLVAKWLPSFFVPGLAMLPLAPSIGSPLEVIFCIKLDDFFCIKLDGIFPTLNSIVSQFWCVITSLSKMFFGMLNKSGHESIFCGCLGICVFSYHNHMYSFGIA